MANNIRELAAYLFVTENQDDENAEMENEAAIMVRAASFNDAMNDLLRQLGELTESATAEEIQFVYYEVGKAFYGTDKDSLRDFFKDIYLLLFGQLAAGRIGVLTKLSGLGFFMTKIRNRLDDPFNLRTLRSFNNNAHIKVQSGKL